jgi:uncharacterized RDD family membrane protein YckC
MVPQPKTGEEPKLDTMRIVETPEGVELTLRVAGPVVRSLAWLIDQAIRATAYLAIGIGLAFFGNLGSGLFLLFLFFAEWFYPVFFEVLRQGSTPGKAVLGLTVVLDDGTPIGWTPSIIRNLLRFGDFLPFAYLLGLISMIASRDFKRLGDVVAGTIVVYRDLPMGPMQLAPADPVPVPIALDLAEQRAIIEFAERSPGWSRERADEVAELLAPLLSTTDQGRSARLLGMAHWLMGRR